MARIVAVTSCPTGIAHTFMAAEAIEQGARELGHTVKVETQGSVGAENPLSPEDIRQADVVIIAADTKVDLARFVGKRVYQTSTNAAINDGKTLVQRALSEAVVLAAADKAEAYVAEVEAAKAKRAAERTGVYKHLMTGVSYMIPFVVAGGLLIAIAFAARGIYAFDPAKDLQGNPITPTPWTTFWANLFAVGAQGGFGLMVPILAGFIAFSIADRPGLAPGMIGGVVAGLTGSGFLGGIVAGFIAGYFTLWLNQALKLPRNLQGLKPVLILPLLGSLVVGILMFYVVGTPVKAALDALTAWLNSLQSGSKAVLGLILGAMMAFDMGGPVNKAAYTFSVGLISAHVYQPMAAVMAAGMTPPLGLALATWLFKNRFTSDEREAGKAAAVLGISFITEGAIPFAARDPLCVIPSIMVGSAVAAALSMIFGCGLRVPHGGIFVLPIPNAVENLGLYVVAILVGTVVTTAMLYVVKKPLSE